MQYFTDGVSGFIRVNTVAPIGSREFFFAKAEKLDAEGTWFEKPKLMVELLNSGYYEPATDDEVAYIISIADLTPDEMIGAHTFSSTQEIFEDPEVRLAMPVSG